MLEMPVKYNEKNKQKMNPLRLEVRGQAISHGAVLLVFETLRKSLNCLMLLYEMSLFAGKNEDIKCLVSADAWLQDSPHHVMVQESAGAFQRA